MILNHISVQSCSSPSQCSMVVLTLLSRPAKPVENGTIGGVRTAKLLNQLTQNLAWVITLAISVHMPQFKAIALVGASRHMSEISITCMVF